jgi:Sec-independent protein translocase protein TatA
MFSIAVPELIILIMIVILVFGPERVGRGIREICEDLRARNRSSVKHVSTEDKENKFK